VHARYITPKRMCSESRDQFKFWEIRDNISETVQDRDIQGAFKKFVARHR